MGAVGRGRLPLLVSIYSGNRKSPASFQSKGLRREESCGSATRWSRDRPHVASVPNSSGSRYSFWLSNSCKAKKNPSRVTAANCFRQVVASIARPYRTIAFFQAWRLALGGHSQSALPAIWPKIEQGTSSVKAPLGHSHNTSRQIEFCTDRKEWSNK